MKTITIKFCLIFIIFALFIPACRPETQTPAQASADIIIVYKREGGFAGFSQQWTIHPDGQIDAPGEQELTADREDTSALLTLSSSEEIQQLDRSYIPEDNCCDKFLYTVTIINGDEEKTIETTDDVSQPEALAELLTAIEMLIADASAN